MIDICQQLACGMEHMADRRLIHMDLAARNCLVGSHNRVKVADFGMTRPCCRDDQHPIGPYCQLKTPIKMAVKWGSPEAVQNLLFSEKSDIWAAGVTMWEVLSYGKMPWSHDNNVSTLRKISQGKRMDMPKKANPAMWKCILSMWTGNPEKRPVEIPLSNRTSAREHWWGAPTPHPFISGLSGRHYTTFYLC